MADSLSQSTILPRELLEAVGDVTGALKLAKTELKDLEKEAKRIEKKGGVVSDELSGRIESARGARGRMERRLERQRVARKREKAAAFDLRNRESSLRRAATSPVSALKEIGVEAALKTKIGRRAVGTATRIGKIGARIAGSPVVALPAALQFGGSAGYAYVQRERQLYLDQSLGNLQIAETTQNMVRGAAIGGAALRDAGRIITRALDDKATRAEAIAERTISGAIERAVFGRSAQQNQMGTRAAEQVIRRQNRILQFGAGYQQATERARVTQTRATQIKDAYLKERGSWIAELATRYIGGEREVVDPTARLWQLLTVGQVDARTATMETAILTALEREDRAWDEARQAAQNQYNTSTAYAQRRARANQRLNAVRAYEADKLQRGVTWRLQ